jgi:SAM-dependent methyltransferase
VSALPPLSPNAWLRWDVVSRLLPPAGVDVLEIGAGQGGYAARLAGRYRYVGLEPDPESYAVAAARVAAVGGTGEMRNSDLSALGPDERFDVVCAFEVIEHIEDDVKALAEWTERLRPGGWLILSTPATQDRFGPADVMAGHFRRYDPPVMAERLGQAGLVDIEIVHFGTPLGYLLEAARNAVGRRRNAEVAGSPIAERTGGSGRLLQPTSRLQGALTRVGTAPFRLVQRAFPSRGPGLVVRARRPATD